MIRQARAADVALYPEQTVLLGYSFRLHVGMTRIEYLMFVVAVVLQVYWW